MAPRVGLWLRCADGVRVRIGERGVLIGRRRDADVVVGDPHASQVHALVLRAGSSAEVHALGLNPTLRNGEPVKRRARLEPGDCLEVPGMRMWVEAGGLDPELELRWVIETRTTRHGVRGGLRVGGGDGDDLHIEGWPPGALLLSVVDGGLVAEFDAALVLAGEPVEPGTVEMLDDGDVIEHGGTAVEVRSEGPASRATVRAPIANLPVYARLAFLPTGGELTMEFVDGRRVTLQLSERRASLVACLLSPPGEYEAGDFVPDELLVGRVWPGQRDRGRMDVNTLVHRTRKDLLRAGVNPAPILARAKGGRATSFRLAPGGRAEVV